MIPTINNNIVVLEANPARRDYIRSILSQLGHIPISFDRETICLDNLPLLNPHLVILGSLSLEKTFRFINTIKMRCNGLGIVIISDDHSIKKFIDINGFDDVLLIKPSFDPYEIKNAICRIQNDKLKNEIRKECPIIIGNSPEMVKIKKMIFGLRQSSDTVLVQGEPGTGKELVVRAIHQLSNRKNNPLVKVKIEDLSNEWFGYDLNPLGEVQKKKKEIFKIANTGTLFLDKIEKASASFQAKILQILDGKSSLMTEDERLNKFDIRIVATTRENLNLFLKKRGFRKDLFYRLNVISIKIPPLKDRVEDIPLLADFFNDRFCGEFARSYYDIPLKNKDIFSSYHWPGNVRELKNVIKNMVSTADKDNISVKFIENNQHHESLNVTQYKKDLSTLPDTSKIKTYLKDLNKISLKDIQKEFIIKTEKKLMKEALLKTNWNRKKASILLDISYKSMLNKIKAYNIA